MRKLAILTTSLAIFLPKTHANDTVPVIRSISPNGRVVLAAKSIADSIQLTFTSKKDGREVGNLLTSKEISEMTIIGAIAGWNQDSDKVVILLFYGNKQTEIFACECNADGMFSRVDFSEPNPIEIYNRSGRQPKISDGDADVTENSLGPWLSRDVVRLISGTSLSIKNMDKHVLVTYNLHLVNGKAKVEKLKLVGLLSQRNGDNFLRKWGEKYWQLDD